MSNHTNAFATWTAASARIARRERMIFALLVVIAVIFFAAAALTLIAGLPLWVGLAVASVSLIAAIFALVR